MPQPSISGMDPPFGDFFQTYTFADQALTSTDLLASNTDPDFMYELDRDMTNRQSPKGDHSTVGDYKEMECGEYLLELVDSDPDYSSNFEQWDTYWEDMTKYTRFTSCDIWGTKEAGLDDFSSPYQDEEVIGQTPTLAQLNSEDSQPPVCDTLYHPDLLMGGQKQHSSLPPLSLGKKMAARLGPSFSASCSNLVRDPLGDFAEGSLSATWPVPSTTETMSKAQGPSKMAALGHHCNDYVRKATVRVSMPCRPLVDMPMASHQIESEDHSPYPSKPPEVATTSGCAAPVAAPATAASASASILAYEKREELPCRVMPPASVGTSGAVPPILHYPVAGAKASESLLTASGSALGHDPVSDKKKEEEHNYSLFLTRARLAGKTLTEMDEEEEEEEEVGEMEDEEDAEGVELDEDHDEGFGSEHELSENEDDDDEDDDDEEDDDYEGDKDDDMSDTFSEPGSHVSGCDNDTVGDVKGLTAGISRKRGKRRYFWEYSEQLTPSKQERMLKPSEWDRQTLPSNLYQRNGPHHGKYNLKKSRRTDVEDLTPNPRKLLQIGNELRKLNKVISDLTPVSELPITARPRSRKEKNKLASRACRLKKKAQYEANKVKLWGLGTEYDRLLFVINTIKEEMVNRVQDICDKETSMTETLDKLIEETLVKSPVAGETSDFVNQILENTGKGDPTGGLVGLRVPTSRV